MNLILGDCIEVMKTLADNSVDALVTDPPYGWRFMGKAWDGKDIVEKAKRGPTTAQKGGDFQGPNRGISNQSSSAGEYDLSRNGNYSFQLFSEEYAKEVMRVLKPGGHCLVFCGPRTYHRMACGFEDAGFEIRDQLQWIFGSGFPKSLNVNNNLGGMHCECKKISESSVRCLPETNLPKAVNAKNKQDEILQQGMQEQGLQTHGEKRTESKTANGKESCMEGRCYLQEEQGKLHRPKVCSVSDGVHCDGSQGRICDGAQIDCSSDYDPLSDTNRGGTSQRPQHKKQPSEESNLLFRQQVPQTCGSCRKPIIPEGLGTALKPANEPILLARKPLSEKTVAANVLKWGTGGINVDASRIRVDRADDNIDSKDLSHISESLKRILYNNQSFFECARNAIDHYPNVQRCVSNLSGVGDSELGCLTCLHLRDALLRFSKVCDQETSPLRRDALCDIVRLRKEWKRNLGCPNTDRPSISDALDLFPSDIYPTQTLNNQGRFPANLILDEEAAEMLDRQSLANGIHSAGKARPKGMAKLTGHKATSWSCGLSTNESRFGDSGGASRFFYCAKSSKRERNKGLDSIVPIWEGEAWQKPDLSSLVENISQLARGISEDILKEDSGWNTDLYGHSISEQYPKGLMSTIETTIKLITELRTSNSSQNSNTRESIQDAIKSIWVGGNGGLNLAESVEFLSQCQKGTIPESTESLLGVVLVVLQMLLKISAFGKSGNFHPTCKPISLMRYLCRLITPPNGIVLDPFMGSGSTGIAAREEGFHFIGIEREKEYYDIANARIKNSAPVMR